MEAEPRKDRTVPKTGFNHAWKMISSWTFQMREPVSSPSCLRLFEFGFCHLQTKESQRNDLLRHRLLSYLFFEGLGQRLLITTSMLINDRDGPSPLTMCLLSRGDIGLPAPFTWRLPACLPLPEYRAEFSKINISVYCLHCPALPSGNGRWLLLCHFSTLHHYHC